MKKINTIAAIILLSLNVLSQVPKKIVVEHFTNSSCGACASRNPGFYTNLNSQSPRLLHLSIHPSSPYSNCLLYQQNTTANDARTNYYGIYGGTPRIVINGAAISPSVNYSSASLFTPYQSQTSPASMRVIQQKFADDSIKTTVIVKTVSSNSLSSVSLFVALAEDTVFFTGNNGEAMHFDVFRKSLTSTSGITLNLPATIGDSVVYSFISLPNPIWNFSRIYALAILQETSSKSLVQSETALSSNGTSVGINQLFELPAVSVFPNPFNSETTIDLGRNQSKASVKITDLMGKVVFTRTNILDKEVVVQKGEMKAGVYFLNINDNNSFNKKIIIQ